MQHVLRAISGPHAGAVYVLGSRTTIGRASDCDIQILHEGVSRHHAKLTLEDDGSVVVADLSSDNGTFVDEIRVERRVLVEGEVVRVMRSRFTYEVQEVHEAQTSATFRRKVTSGDSLRQTVHHDKPITALRAGLAQSLPGSSVGERGRVHSRPQAAAPALSGARPGAATGQVSSVEAPAFEPEPAPETVDEAPRVRRPTPPVGMDTAAGVRERRARAPVASSEARVSPGRMRSRPPEPVRGDDAQPSEAEAARSVASPASPGRQVALGPGRRERTIAPTSLAPPSLAPPSLAPPSLAPPSLAPPSGASSVRIERATAPLAPSGPSGRMASLAPSAVEHEPDPQAAAPMASGWTRVARPLDAPGSMRPGSTLGGIPKVEADPPSSSAAHAVEADTPERPKSITAEYGSLGERQVTERGLAAPPPVPVPTAAAAPEGGTEGDLDAMKTVPSVRRKARRGSATPTEEVPRIRDADDESHRKTQPRITIVPSEPDPGPVTPAGAVTNTEANTEADAVVDSDPEDNRVTTALPAATRPPDSSPPAFARRLTVSGGARARSIAYEDTLRFQRPDPREPARPDVPQARHHATSAEIISALEALLPPDDAAAPTSDEEGRPDARTHDAGIDAAATLDALLEVTIGDDAWASDIADLSDADRAELRTRQVLEQADREHRRREGLERLVDILEYRELRVRALQNPAGDAREAERCAVLEQALQQRPPAGEDTGGMRRYHRFVCSIPAQLTHRPRGTASTATVEIEDLSAGGAKITFGEYSIGAGETVWLTIDLAEADRSRIPYPNAGTVVMKARVVWAHPRSAVLGVIFAGAPQYDGVAGS